MIRLTPSAKEKMVDVLISEKAKYLRFGLHGGGCNGFQYYFSVSESTDEDDSLIDLGHELFLIVDPTSMMYLTEAEIDYKRDLMGETFVFNNPQTKNTCGCGNSIGF
jgi:iron-sulfur cluster insertion protein